MRSLAHRLSFMLVAVALLGALLSVFGARTVATLAGNVQSLLDRDTVIAVAVLRAQNHMARMDAEAFAELSGSQPRHEVLARAMRDRLGDYRARVEEMEASSADGREEAAQMRPRLQAIGVEAERVLDFEAHGEIEAARKTYTMWLTPLLQRNAVLTRQRAETWMAALRRDRSALLSEAASSRTALQFAAVLPALGALASILWVLGQGLRQPLLRLAVASDALGRGDYASPVPDTGRGDEIGYLAGILEQLRLEAMRAAALERVARDAEAERLRALTNAVFEGIAICEHGVIEEANRSLATMAGLSRSQLSGTRVDDLLRADTDIPLGQAIAAGETAPINGVLMTIEGPAPVRLQLRFLTGRDGGARTVITVRDLRAPLQAEDKLRFARNHDGLTGLTNRTGMRDLFTDALKRARASRGSVTLLTVGLDHFRTMNAIHGQEVGDRFLIEMASRLVELTGDRRAVARVGGDEFAVIVEADQEDGTALAEAIVRTATKVFQLGDGRQLVGSASIGLVVCQETTEDIEALLASAKMALQAAKLSGRSSWRMFSRELREATELRAALGADLPAALAEQQFSVAYQPQTITATGEIVAFEALLRWRHPTLGPVSPAMFVPIAEELGLISEIGAWVLRVACTEAAGWARKCRIAVNVSPLQIEKAGFVQLVETTLSETALEPSRLEVEITEGMLVRDATTTTLVMNALKRMGVGVALDDFGTGYSSLSTLHNFAFDRVKIDRAFVAEMTQNPKSAAIVRAVIALGHSLDVPVLAEGVETEEQRAALEAEGCEEIQGYLIGRPLPVEAVRLLVCASDNEAAMAAA